jgi:hypothetical protein
MTKNSSGHPNGSVTCRVARWYVFKPKILIWVTFGGPLNGHVCKFQAHLELLCSFGIFLSFGNFVVIWYIFPVLVYCFKKNLATLMTWLFIASQNFVLAVPLFNQAGLVAPRPQLFPH